MGKIKSIEIPVYTLAQNSRRGHTMIEVRRGTGLAGEYVEPAFLIPHRKDYYLFALIKEGSSRHWVDFVPYTLEKDTFYFTTPEQVHLKEEMEPSKGLFLWFSNEFLQLDDNRSLARLPILQNPAQGHVLRLTAEELHSIEDSMEKLLIEFDANGAWKNQMLNAQLGVLLIQLSRIYTAQYGEHNVSSGSLLARFRALINTHYQEIHDVASYAAMLHLSADHFSEVVKEQSGRTAITHIHERILVEAKRLLLHTAFSVKEVADQLGFEDAAYFNRWFRRLAGTTPLQYRGDIQARYRV